MTMTPTAYYHKVHHQINISLLKPHAAFLIATREGLRQVRSSKSDYTSFRGPTMSMPAQPTVIQGHGTIARTTADSGGCELQCQTQPKLPAQYPAHLQNPSQNSILHGGQ